MNLPRTRADQWDVQEIVKVRVSTAAQAACVSVPSLCCMLCMLCSADRGGLAASQVLGLVRVRPLLSVVV